MYVNISQEEFDAITFLNYQHISPHAPDMGNSGPQRILDARKKIAQWIADVNDTWNDRETIIAGSRKIKDRFAVYEAINSCPWRDSIVKVLSGKAPGVDTFGEEWAVANRLLIDPYPAKWDDLNVPGAIIEYHADGTPYNRNAGFDRNELMASRADSLILIWDGKSSGSKMMLKIAQQHGLLIHQRII